MNRALRSLVALALLLAAALGLNGCQEFQGPLWSPDGHRIAYTTYTPTPAGPFETNLYWIDAEDDAAKPQFVAKGAAFPHWQAEGNALYFAGERDPQGFYTKVFKITIPGEAAPQAVLSNLKISQLQMSIDGDVALLISSKDGRPGGLATVEQWSPADNKRVQFSQLGDIYSPVLMPNGKAIAYSQRPAETLPFLVICNLDGQWDAKAYFPTEEENEPNATSYVIHALPDNERFLFYAPGGTAIWTVKRDAKGNGVIKKYPLPDGLTTPLMVSTEVSQTLKNNPEDLNAVYVTLARGESGHVRYEVHKLDLTNKRYARIEGDSEAFIGGQTLDPRAIRRKAAIRHAWLSPAGFALGEINKTARYFPVDGKQHLAASLLLVKQNQPAEALEALGKAREAKLPPEDAQALEHAEAKISLAAKQNNLAASAFERALLFYPVTREGIKMAFGPESGLAPSDFSTELKDMDEIMKAAPENRMIPLMKEALNHRLKGEHAQALANYRQALPLCADRATEGAVRFQTALCNLESGDLLQAGEKWESAARSDDFPQADYAAVLSAIAYALDGRPESLTKAQGVLALPVMKNSPLAAGANTVVSQLKGKQFKAHGLGKDSFSRDRATKAWLEVDRYQMPFAALRPLQIQEGGKFVERQFGVRPMTASTVFLEGRKTPLFKIGRPISDPLFSPNGLMVAFAVNGQVFPLPDSDCEVFVLDQNGTVLVGDPRAGATGRVAARQVIQKFEWSSEKDLKVTGAEVDVFGGETAFTKTLNVPVK